MNTLFTKVAISFGASATVAESVKLDSLWTALITLAVSVLTCLSVEGVAWLRAYLKAKKANREAEEKEYQKKCEEADEVVESVMVAMHCPEKDEED